MKEKIIELLEYFSRSRYDHNELQEKRREAAEVVRELKERKEIEVESLR